MKKSLRLVTLAVVVFMLSAFLGAAAYAHSFTDVKEYDEAIGTLTSVGVIRGQTSTIFNPNSNIKRWQMALLLTKLLTAETNDTLWEKTSGNIAFTDVTNSNKHYGGSIAYAVSNGIIIGRSATEFAPDAGITLQDAVTMVVRSLQYPRSTYDPGYPDSYLTKGAELGLLDLLSDVDATDVLTRGETAQLLYNAFRAERYDGSTIQEDVFGYESETMVLAATDEESLDAAINLASAGKIAFHVLNSNGTIANRASMTIDADDLEAELEFGASYKIAMCKGDILSIEKCKSTVIYDKLVVSSASSTKIAINSVVYTPASRYSYNLEEGKIPSGSKEIIIYGLSDLYYTPYQVLTSEELYGTTARYELTGFDDNGDGYLDRAIYKPYSFGQYTIDGSTTRITGKDKTISFQNGRVSISGAKPTSGAYILYNYNKDTAELEVESVMSQADAYFKSYASGRVTLYTSSVNNVKTYNLGNTELPGVDVTAVTNAVRSLSSGASVRFVTDGSNILAVVSSTGTGTGGGTGSGGTSNVPTYSENTIVSTSVGVVSRVDTSSAASGTMVVYLNNTTALYVSSLNGSAVSAVNSSLAAGDLIEYTQLGSSSAVTVLNNKPYVTDTVTGSSSTRTAFIDYTTNYFGFGYRTGTGANAVSTYMAQVAANSSTVIYYYNGTSIVPYSVNNLSGGISVGSGYSVYVVINSTSASAASIIYIRPAVVTPNANPTISGGSKLTGSNYAIVTEVNTNTAASGYITVKTQWPNRTMYVSVINNLVVSDTNKNVAVGDIVSYETVSYAPPNFSAPAFYRITNASAVPYLINNTTNVTYISYANNLLTVSARTSATGSMTSLGSIAIPATSTVIMWDGITFSATNPGALITKNYNQAYSVYAVYSSTVSATPSFLYIRPNYVLPENNQGVAGNGNVVAGGTITNSMAGYIKSVSSFTPGYTGSSTGSVQVQVLTSGNVNNLSTYVINYIDNMAVTSSSAASLKVGDLVSVNTTLNGTASLQRFNSGAYAALKETSRLYCSGGYFYLGKENSTSTTDYTARIPVDYNTKIVVSSGIGGVTEMTSTNCSLNLSKGFEMYVLYSSSTAQKASIIYFRPGSGASTGTGTVINPSQANFSAVVYIPSATGTQIGTSVYYYVGYNVMTRTEVVIQADSTKRITQAGYYGIVNSSGVNTFASTTPLVAAFSNSLMAYEPDTQVSVSSSMGSSYHSVTIGMNTYRTQSVQVFSKSASGLTPTALTSLGTGNYAVFMTPVDSSGYTNAIVIIK